VAEHQTLPSTQLACLSYHILCVCKARVRFGRLHALGSSLQAQDRLQSTATPSSTAQELGVALAALETRRHAFNIGVNLLTTLCLPGLAHMYGGMHVRTCAGTPCVFYDHLYPAYPGGDRSLDGLRRERSLRCARLLCVQECACLSEGRWCWTHSASVGGCMLVAMLAGGGLHKSMPHAGPTAELKAVVTA